MASTAEELNTIGINRIIESASRVAKDEDEAGRRSIFNSASAVIAECDLPADEIDRVIELLREALKI